MGYGTPQTHPQWLLSGAEDTPGPCSIHAFLLTHSMDDGMSRVCEYGEIHCEPVTDAQDILSVKRFQRAQTDWANLANAGSKYFEERHDHDFLENVFPIIHLRIQLADISGKLYDVAVCRAVSAECSLMHACGVAGKVGAAHSPWQAQETVINTSHLERALSRKKVPQEITMTVLQGLAAFNQTVSEDESRVKPQRSHQTQSITSTATVWELVEDANSSVVQQLFCINDAVTGRRAASRDKIPSSLLHSVSKEYVSPADLALRSLKLSLTIVRSQLFEVCHAGAETGDVGDLRQENLPRHQQLGIGRGVLLAISVFFDVFPEALNSPDVPLRQLDADSLILSELADALTKTCKKVVKVVDLFSYNTLVDVLHHVFEL
jgi:hypothetical protein